ncbi:C-C motif chemokine 4-like [Astatotilapia calliptera]|uniref:C-C motif chemokine 4-like n=1 Tax=Astatotilapia calliptera TaxID=8154 RepID=UPI00032A1C0A|nr:C-C motif chemokine 4-like [Astatotilapia calliptera]
MKTLSLTVGLLLVLFIIYYGDATPHGVKPTPDLCCFKFYERKIPTKQIKSIKKTHSKCTTPAFVIKTPRGDFCVRQNENWALKEFVQRK